MLQTEDALRTCFKVLEFLSPDILTKNTQCSYVQRPQTEMYFSFMSLTLRVALENPVKMFTSLFSLVFRTFDNLAHDAPRTVVSVP